MENNKEFDKAVAARNYEIYSAQCVNKSREAKKILQKIKEGHTPNEVEVFTLVCKDKKKIVEYAEMMDIKKRMNDGQLNNQDIAYLSEKAFGKTNEAAQIQNAFNDFGKGRE